MSVRRAARAVLGVVAEWLPLVLLVVVGPGLVSVAQMVHDPHLTWSVRHPSTSDWLFRSGCLVMLAASLVVAVRDRRRAAAAATAARWRMRTETAERAIARLAREELRQVVNTLGVYSNGRVSLFRAHHDDHFDLVARFSLNPTFDHGPGRGRYPMHEGALGKVWAEHKWFGPSLPSAGAVGGPPSQRWIEQQRRVFGVSQDVAANLTMRTRTYGGVRVDLGGRCLGVLLFEDLRPLPGSENSHLGTSPTQDAVFKAFTEELGTRLAALLEESGAVACDTWEPYRRALALGNPPPPLPGP